MAEVTMTFEHPFVRFMQVIALLCVIAMVIAIMPAGDEEDDD